MSGMKPCPFCGEQVFPPLTSSFDDSYTRCGFCGAMMLHNRWQTRPIEDELTARIAELEEENDRLQDAWFKDETICPDGSLKPKVSTLLSRIAELTECIGSQMADVYTLKARIAELEEDKRSLRDSNLWLKQNYEDLERDYGVMHEKMCARIDKLKGAIEILEDQQRETYNILIDKNLHIDSLYEEGYKLQRRIAELEAENDQLTAHSDIERQDDKSSNDTQKETVVYGKECEE